MTREEKLALLSEWEATIQAMEVQMDALQAVTGSTPESPLCAAVWDLVRHYTASVSARVGDEAEWLEWHLYENQLGAKGMEAGFPDTMRSIQTVEDLLALFEEVAR